MSDDLTTAAELREKRPPSVMAIYEKRLAELSLLDKDWDTYGGKPMHPDAVEGMLAFLRAIVEGTANLVPTSDGGVDIEVYQHGFEIDVGLVPHAGDDESAAEGQYDVEGVWERAKPTKAA